MTESDTLVAPDCDRGKAKDDPTRCSAGWRRAV